MRLTQEISNVSDPQKFDIFQFDQSGLTYGHQYFYLGNQSGKYQDAAISYIKDVAKLLGASEADLLQAEDIYDFELSIARVSVMWVLPSHGY